VDLRAQGFNYIATNAWLADDWIVFTGRQGETQTLWKIRLGPDGKSVSKALRATSDAQGDYGASFAAGKLVFSPTEVDMNFWALPLDDSGEHIAASPEPLTFSAQRKGQQSMSGAKLLYSRENGDRFSLFLKDGSKEIKLRDGFFSLLAPTGDRYVWGDGAKEHLIVNEKSLKWWSFWSSTLCTNCGMPRQFTADGKKLLLWSDTPPIHRIDLLDMETHRTDQIVWSKEDLKGPQLSPDGRRVSFVTKAGKGGWQAFAAPVSQGKLVNSSEWIALTPAVEGFFYAFWSLRGNIIYTLSAHAAGGNLRFLDAQSIDSLTKRPFGDPQPVYQFDETLVPGMDPVWNHIEVEGNRIILELGGLNTDIWAK
jgi:hypothetical protein